MMTTTMELKWKEICGMNVNVKIFKEKIKEKILDAEFLDYTKLKKFKKSQKKFNFTPY